MFRVDTEELAGKSALVTGGTQGVGAAIVARLGAAGAKVTTTARTERPGSDGADFFVRADVTTPDGVSEVSRAVLERYGSTSWCTTSVGRRRRPAGSPRSPTRSGSASSI
jgi:NAD(P)-dependent dehydrogenase (short-subunit alcohol dehydrogenase family)